MSHILAIMALWQDGSLPWLIVHSAIYLAIGLALFAFAQRLAKQRGLLGQD